MVCRWAVFPARLETGGFAAKTGQARPALLARRPNRAVFRGEVFAWFRGTERVARAVMALFR